MTQSPAERRARPRRSASSAGIAQLAALKRRLQRLHSIEHEQRTLGADEPGETLALFPWRTGRRVGIAEKTQRSGDKNIGRPPPSRARPG